MAVAKRELRKQRSFSEIVLDYGIVIAFAVLFAFLAFQTEAFFTVRNQLNILDQAHQIGLMAVAVTVVIIAGGFDLSMGAIFAMSGVVAAFVARDLGQVEAFAAAAPYLGWIAGVGVGTLFGLLNGVLVTVLGINTFVATLASGIVIRGLALIITQAEQVRVSDDNFQLLARGSIGDVRNTVILWLGFALILTFVLTRTKFGRYVFAAGDNPEAARLSGINVILVRTITFGISGFAAGLAGVISASKFMKAQNDAGQGLELIAIAAVVIGGTSIFGGVGGYGGTFSGVGTIVVLLSFLQVVGLSDAGQQIAYGAVLLLMLILFARQQRKN
ncbi:MAG: ABC transporter permease [Gammaproteobacteria bacterium]|nr:ABC transporter permease [Gammaproteobacteria bacterium]